MEILVTIVVFLIILSVLVLIHEAGHFFVAKKLGIKVEEFGFGFPPRAFGIKKGETLYSINWLPIGGFVKLYGEDDAGGGKLKVQSEKFKVKDEKRAFYARSVGQRAAVVVAGVVMNAVLAILIFYVYLGISNFKAELPYFGPFNFLLANQTRELRGIIVADVAENSPAQKIGLHKCSQKSCIKIDMIDGVGFKTSDEFSSFIKSNAGKEITLSLKEYPSGKKSSVTVVPRINPPKGQGALGIAFEMDQVYVLSYNSFFQKIFSGVAQPINVMLYQLNVMGKLIMFSFQAKTIEPVSQGFSGPVGIGSLVGSILGIEDVKEKTLQLLNLAGILSISLAFFNILPIPALDGGRLLFIVIEGVSGRKVNQRIEGYIHSAGMAVLLTLILLVTFKDIGQLFK